jgi:hypothetical protein
MTPVTLSFRFPDEDKEIKRGAQLIVRESQIYSLFISANLATFHRETFTTTAAYPRYNDP